MTGEIRTLGGEHNAVQKVSTERPSCKRHRYLGMEVEVSRGRGRGRRPRGRRLSRPKRLGSERQYGGMEEVRAD